MTVFLNILFIVVGVLFFAGRLYEVIYFMEEGTNFLVGKGVVTSPLMLGILFLISVCCSVIAFADKEKDDRTIKLPVGIFGVIPAPFIIIASVLNIIGIFKTGGFLGYDIMMILAAVGFAMLGLMNIKGKNREKIPAFMVVLMPLAMCMNCIILNIQPIYNTMFLYYSLSAITLMIFLLMLFKNAYAPSALAKPMLYVFSLVNFLTCGCASMANLIGGFFLGNIAAAELLLDVALAVLGLYSLFIAFYVVSNAGEAQKRNATSHNSRPRKALYQEYEEDDVVEFIPKPAQPAKETSNVFLQEADTRQINKISQETIAALFARKDEREHNTVIEEFKPAAVVEQPVESYPTLQVETSFEPTKEITTQVTNSKIEKNIFKGSGKKETSGKVVYKAPKK